MAGGAAQGGFRGGFTGALAGALPLTSWTNKRNRKTPNLNKGNSMQYFAGSLSNPKIPSGKDNRNVFPAFSGSFSRGGAQPSSQQGMPLQPRNEAFSLPRILNPSPAYKAFAIPQGVSPYLRAIYQSFGPNRYRV
jgi:hypothetical protein